MIGKPRSDMCTRIWWVLPVYILHLTRAALAPYFSSTNHSVWASRPVESSHTHIFVRKDGWRPIFFFMQPLLTVGTPDINAIYSLSISRFPNSSTSP